MNRYVKLTDALDVIDLFFQFIKPNSVDEAYKVGQTRGMIEQSLRQKALDNLFDSDTILNVLDNNDYDYVYDDDGERYINYNELLINYTNMFQHKVE